MVMVNGHIGHGNNAYPNVPIGAGNMIQNITSSYITIGGDDPFLTGRFCDASTKQFTFKPPGGSKLNPPMMKSAREPQSSC